MMAGQSASNPFKKIILGLWTQMELSSTFTTLVPQGNRIKVCDDDKPQPMKDQHGEGDFPTVTILPVAHSIDQRGSNSTVWSQRYTVAFQTGDKRTSWFYDDIKWEIVKTLTRLFGANLDTLSTTWGMPSGTRVVRIWPGEASDQMASSANVREGWTGLFQITVEFVITESTFATP